MARQLVEREPELRIPFNDRDTDPTFAEGVLEEIWDMVKRVRRRGGRRREERYDILYPLKGVSVSITVRREDWP
jgi:hypothetical protein